MTKWFRARYQILNPLIESIGSLVELTEWQYSFTLKAISVSIELKARSAVITTGYSLHDDADYNGFQGLPNNDTYNL